MAVCGLHCLTVAPNLGPVDSSNTLCKGRLAAACPNDVGGDDLGIEFAQAKDAEPRHELRLQGRADQQGVVAPQEVHRLDGRKRRLTAVMM